MSENPTIQRFVAQQANKPVSEEQLNKIHENLAKSRLDPSQEIPDPEPVMRQGDYVFMTKENFSAVVGQAKSRKTFLTTAIAGAYLAEDEYMGMNSPTISGPLLWIDTEMAKGHVARVTRRINRISGKEARFKNDNLVVYCLREYSPTDRRLMLEEAIKLHKPAICVLDGVADLVDSVNDEYACSELITMLMRATKEHNCHILSVIHLNPGSSKPRGHLGSEVLRKSETVLLVKKEKDKDGSKVVFERCRDLNANDFSFFVDSTGLPQLYEDEAGVVDDKKKDKLLKAMQQVMPDYPASISFADLTDNVCKAMKVKERAAKKRISDMLSLGFIVKNTFGAYVRAAIIKQVEIDLTPTDDEELPF